MQTLDSLVRRGLAYIVQAAYGRDDVALDTTGGRRAVLASENWHDPRHLAYVDPEEPYFLAEPTDAGFALYEPHREYAEYRLTRG